MDSDYDEKSCSALGKPFYLPIEAAIRWCNLLEHELMIFEKLQDELVPPRGMFPQWPCLLANTEIIYDALDNAEMPCGRDGKTVSLDDHVAPHRRTVRHTDLKKWMTEHHPGQKPAFLFDEIERSTHKAIDADAFRALQADRDALKTRIDKAVEAYRDLKIERDDLIVERDSLLASAKEMAIPGERSETTYLNVIGGLLSLVIGQSSEEKSLSAFANQSAVIDALLEGYENKPGIKKRTLEQKFAAAKESLRKT